MEIGRKKCNNCGGSLLGKKGHGWPKGKLIGCNEDCYRALPWVPYQKGGK